MKLATIETIKNVEKHPNADTLDLVSVLGYKAIVKLGQYKIGDKVVFIQPDTVLPDKPWAEFYKSKSSRVKAIKLRGIWSMGIVESLTTVGLEDLPVGTEVSGRLGIIKYEPPIPQDLSAKGCLPHGIFKTDEERYQNLESIPYGKIVDVTLKVDGSSLTVYYKDGLMGICSRGLELKPECVNNYTTIVKKIHLFEEISHYCFNKKVNLAFRGEMYGNGINGSKINPHSKLPLGFKMFSVLNLDTLQYERKGSNFYFNKVCIDLNIPPIDTLEENVILTPELIKKYDEELTEINGQPFEGVVINGDNFSFKVINKYYDSKK